MTHELFEVASKIAKEAVKLDEQRNPAGASKKYLQAAEILLKLSKVTDNTKLKKICFDTAEQYVKRAKELRGAYSSRMEPQYYSGEVSQDNEELTKNISDIILTEKPDVRWTDVADLKEAKQALREAVVIPMLRPDLFTGARKPWRGLLLFGPPGCGKCIHGTEQVILGNGEIEAAADLFKRVEKELIDSDRGEYVFKPKFEEELASIDISGRLSKDKISYLYYKKDGGCLKIKFEDGCEIKVGVEHPLLLSRKHGFNWIRSKKLRSGDLVASINSVHDKWGKGFKELVRPLKIEDISEFKGDVYDFELAGNHNYLIGPNIISHNTFISKALANEVKATFFSADAASLVSKWLGESEKAVKSLFKMARENSPSIIFIDEVDAIATTRDTDEVGGERRLKTQMLIEMDGVRENKGDQIVVLGATNRPWDLDPAFRRRFEKRIYIPLPDRDARKEVFKHHLRGIELDGDVDFDELAERSQGFTSSDIALICRESSMIPVRELDDEGLLENIDVKLRAVNKRDLISSLTKIKPIVTATEIKKYEEWASEHSS